MSNVHEYEYTDTFNGDANYTWVKRGMITMPELTHYGYDGGTNYSAANRAYNRELMRRVKAAVGLTGVDGRTEWHGDDCTFRPSGMACVLFINFKE